MKDSSNLEGIVIILVIIFILIISPKNDSPQSSRSLGSNTTLSNYSSSDNFELILGSGNAPYSYQSYEEYITLENRGRGEVNITGWQLKNGKDERVYYLGGQLQRFNADTAIIPQATLLLSPTGNSFLQDVTLSSGERAIITTGSINVNLPYSIVSFKENICTGYIDALPEYTFTPSLLRNCPRPADEPGLEALDTGCRTFVKRLNSCETPEFDGRDRRGEPCNGCVNGELLPSSCVAFIKEHFSYRGCVAHHSADNNFSNKTWRIFLGRGWEMWAKDYETIELFDRNGVLINFRNY